MSCSPRVSKKHCHPPGNIFNASGIVPEEFFANTFLLSSKQKQLGHVNGEPPVNTSYEEVEPHDISLVAQDVEDIDEKSRLGKNLLDSFALILAQPGAEGVVATAMKFDEESRSYTIYIARNCDTYYSLSDLIEEIEKWFTIRDSGGSKEYIHGDYIDKPSLNNVLWKKIILNCHLSICKSIDETYSRSQDDIEDELSDVQTWIADEGNQHNKHTSFLQEPGSQKVLKTISFVLEQFLARTKMQSGPGRKNKDFTHGVPHSQMADTELMKFSDTITESCFELLESHEQLLRDLFQKWRQRLRKRLYRPLGATGRINQGALKSKRRLLDKFQRLIYTIANYRRAWYDMVRFKIDHKAATLKIYGLPPTDGPRGAVMDLRCIAKAGVDMKILDDGGEDAFMKEHRSHKVTGSYFRYPERVGRLSALGPNSRLQVSEKKEDRASVWLHCEMQIVEYLLTQNDSNFYNYIGCSKGPCWLCYHSLEYMAPNFEMRQPHLKLYPRWLPPEYKGNAEHRKRFVRVLKFLNNEMGSLLRPENKDQLRSYTLNPDCPDIQYTFLSPRSESMRNFGGY
ncbi:hypothetical protein AAE478_005941 [Parahypoxylon ruwenzoriense]